MTQIDCSNDIFEGCTPVGEIAKRIAKETIMRGREAGVLSDAETAQMIKEMELKHE